MHIKFLTLNIEHGGKLMDNILSFIRRENPDILFIQEVFNATDKNLERRFRTVEVFKEELGDIFPHSDFKAHSYDPDIKAEMGNAVFSKFEIEERDRYFFDVDYAQVHFQGEHDPITVPRILQYVKVKVSEVELNLFNIHGIWGHDGNDNPRRDEMAETIIEKIGNKKNVILAGDTNLNPHTEFVKKVQRELNLKSVFGESLVSTFNMAHKDLPGYATSAVDMIFVSPEFEILEKYMPMDDVSDHRPLVATVNF
jgi:endonuclease/exonuclease/phosphatase family metal-dependent hydrolase